MPSSASAILDHLDKVAIFAGGIFAGTALYMSIGEVPGFKAYSIDQQWRFFPFMYQRAAVSQSCFTAVAGLAGVLHGTRISGAPFYRNLWIGSGILFVGIIPYTLIFMLPTNKRIIHDSTAMQSGSDSQIAPATRKELLEKWELLHLVRTVSSVVGFGAMVFGISQHKSLLLRW